MVNDVRRDLPRSLTNTRDEVVVRVLLINPAMNMGKLGRFARLLEPMPPIGLAYIAAALEQHGCHVRAIDMFAEGLDAQSVVDKVERFKPDLVGMTVLTPSEPVCAQLSARIRAPAPRRQDRLGRCPRRGVRQRDRPRREGRLRRPP